MKSVYLVLDMQNDLVHKDGLNGESPLGEQVAKRNIVNKTAQAIAKARAAGVQVIFVRVGFSSDYKECPNNSPIFSAAPNAGLFQLGTWGTQIHPDLRMNEKDVLLTKHRVSPFFGTQLELLLRTQNVRRIYCSGVSTQAVVQATARDGHDRDFEMVLLEDCCAAHSSEEHENSIQSIERFCHAVTLSDAVVFDSF